MEDVVEEEVVSPQKNIFEDPSIQMILGTYTAWTEWSGCKADCENNPNQAVMSRSQTNVANPRDVKTQSIPCKSPCPPGEMK